jgi:hypothetical protein
MIQDMPVKRPVAAFVAIALLLPAISHGAERFQKLSGSQIRAKFTGMEMTDNVHWADVFGANGELRTFSMGKKKEGKWRVDKDELCLDPGKDEGGCYQVWLSGRNAEFRREGLPAAFEGVLQRPTARN